MVAPQLDQFEGVPVIMTDRSPKISERDTISAAEYALGVLQGKARVEFARRMEVDAALAQAVRQWDENFIEFSEGIEAVQPPPHIASALELRLFTDVKAWAKPSLWRSLNFWRGVTFASMVAVVAMGAWTLRPLENVLPQTGLVAQVGAAESPFKLTAYYDAATSELRLNRASNAAASGRSFELWLIAGQDAPVSLGVLPDAMSVRFKVPEPLRAKFKNGVLAVSDEPQGGSPTGAPTGAVLATGTLTEV